MNKVKLTDWTNTKARSNPKVAPSHTDITRDARGNNRLHVVRDECCNNLLHDENHDDGGDGVRHHDNGGGVCDDGDGVRRVFLHGVP